MHYLRTQITRVTEALISSTPGLPETAQRNAPRGNSGSDRPARSPPAAGRPGPRPPAPSSPPCRRSGPAHRARRPRRIPAPARFPAAACWLRRRAWHYRRDRGSTALRLRIGDANQRDAGLPGGAPPINADRRQVARAIDAQQHELTADIGGDALGIAQTGQRDDVAAVDQVAVGRARDQWRRRTRRCRTRPCGAARRRSPPRQSPW